MVTFEINFNKANLLQTEKNKTQKQDKNQVLRVNKLQK